MTENNPLLSNLDLERLKIARQAQRYARVIAELAGIEGISKTACFKRLVPKFENLRNEILIDLGLKE